MARLRHTETGRVVEVDVDDLPRMQAQGYELIPGQGIAVSTPGGQQGTLQSEDFDRYSAAVPLGAGDEVATAQRSIDAIEEARLQREHGGLGGQVGAFLEGGADFATFGAYGAANELLGGDFEERAQANPRAAGLGQVAGAVSSIGALGKGLIGRALSKTPVGAVSKATWQMGERIGGVRGLAAGAAVEGAAYGALNNLSQAIEDKELTAEVLAVDTFKEALFGAAVGGGAAGILGGMGKLGSRYLERTKQLDSIEAIAGSKAAHDMYGSVSRLTSDVTAQIDDLAVQANRRYTGTLPRHANRLSVPEAQYFDDVEFALGGVRKPVQQGIKEAKKKAKDGLVMVDPGPRVDVNNEFNEVVEGFLGKAKWADPAHIDDFREAVKAARKSVAEGWSKPAREKALRTMAAKARIVGTGRNTTGIPIQITRDMRDKLATAGFSAEDIAHMNPETAWSALYGKIDIKGEVAALEEAVRRAGTLDGGNLPKNVRMYDAKRIDAIEKELIAAERELGRYGGFNSKKISDMLGKAPALATKHEAAVNRYVTALQEAATAGSVDLGDDVLRFAQELPERIKGLQRLGEVDMAAKAAIEAQPYYNTTALNNAKQTLHEMLGIKHNVISSEHFRKMYTLPQESQDKVIRAINTYLKEAQAAAEAMGDVKTLADLERYLNGLGETFSKMYGGAPVSGPGSLQEAFAGIAAVELADDAGLPDELKYMAYGGMFARFGLGKGFGRKSGSKAGFLGKAVKNVAVGSSRYGAAATVSERSVPRSMAQGGARALGGEVGNYILSAGGARTAAAENRGRLRKAAASMLSKAGSGKTAAKAHLGFQWLHRAHLGAQPDDDRPAKYADDNEAFRARSRELAQFASNPEGVRRALEDTLSPMNAVWEEGTTTMLDKVMGAHQYLANYIPKDPGNLYVFGKSMWTPSDVQMYEFAERMRGTLSPVDTMVEGMTHGNLSPEAAHAIRANWPKLVQDAQAVMLEAIEGKEMEVPYQSAVRASVLFDSAFDSTMQPDFRKFMMDFQAQREEDMAAPPPGGGGPSGNNMDSELTPSQKLSR